MHQVSWNPWNFGNGRLSEISIEQLFGRLRRQQSNAQLSTTEFWSTSQREMLEASKRCLQSDGKVAKGKEEPPLTDKQFAECSQRALDAALRLAAWAGGFTKESVKDYYLKACDSGWFDQNHGHALAFDDEASDGEEDREAREMQLAKLKTKMFFDIRYTVMSESDLCQHALRELANLAACAEPETAKDRLTPVQVDTRRLPDEEKADLSELTEAAEGDQGSREDRPLPESLTAALCPGLLPDHRVIDQCIFTLSEDSLKAWEEARTTTAAGWTTSFCGPEVVDQKARCRGRRQRCFKQARRAVRKLANAKAKASPKKKVQKTVEKKPQIRKIEAIPQNFGRTNKGRKLIQQEMEEILALDQATNPSRPVFDRETGVCRLKIPQAPSQTWSKLKQKSCLYFENVYSTRSREHFGTSVCQHFTTLRTQIKEEKRSGWMRLLQALCEMPDVPET
eukprot:Skav221609  [mRNA]  locus=scaffold1698:1023487:1027781:+ [translate_table: standard]